MRAAVQAPGALREGFGLLLRVLYPACPHICCVLWRDLGYMKIVSLAPEVL